MKYNYLSSDELISAPHKGEGMKKLLNEELFHEAAMMVQVRDIFWNITEEYNLNFYNAVCSTWNTGKFVSSRICMLFSFLICSLMNVFLLKNKDGRKEYCLLYFTSGFIGVYLTVLIVVNVDFATARYIFGSISYISLGCLTEFLCF